VPADPESSFRLISEEEIFHGWIFNVARAEILDPDGDSFERFVVRHPGAVAIIAVDAGRRVTLVRQYRAPVDRMVLEAPAGTLDVEGEEPETAARRELAEEAGLTARSMKLLIDTFNTPGISDQHTVVYLATGLSPCPPTPEGVEEGFMTIETIALDDVEALVANGTLVDETTVLGLLLARARLDQDAAEPFLAG
jgi:ADP-ribose pyrophosphatase